MKNKQFKTFHLHFILLIAFVWILSGCAATPKEPVDASTRDKDITEYLKDNVSDNIIVNSVNYKDNSNEETVGLFEAEADYTYGDITYHQFYSMIYNYSRATGWGLSEISIVKKDSWKEKADEISMEKMLEDLENERYYSGYSDMIFENKRLLDSKQITGELDCKTGYYRANIKVTLNADYVHEILAVYLEYLLDENNKFVLSTADVNLENVEVQGSVSDMLIREGIQSLNFYREEEDSIWRVGELNKLTYEVLESELNKEDNSERITLTFRGEGLYMYVSGKCTLTFHFSSGWYLYDSVVDTDSIETGMLSDAWLVDEEMIKEYIVKDYAFNYNEVENFNIEEEMIQNFEITGRKIVSNGQFQTIYFDYDLIIKSTIFKISGYGKYDLTDGFLSVATWSEIINEMTYNLTGTWAGYDVGSDFVSYYQLSLNDDGSGILAGNLDIYSINNKVYNNKNLSAQIDITGNIFKGTSYEILDKEWLKGDFTYGFEIPVGYYLFTEDELIVNNGKYGEFALKRVDEFVDEKDFYSRAEAEGINKFIENKLYEKHHRQ